MDKPRIEILGIYALHVSDELFRKQFDILYGYEMSEKYKLLAEKQCRDQLNSTVLVEVKVMNRDSQFDVSHFTQPINNVPKDNWQTAWAEAYLCPDGESLIVERWSSAPKSGDLRIAFFLHFWNPSKPLRTSYGDLVCPAIKDMPERLSKLVPYKLLD
jgi:hypothetical protein